LYGGHVEVAPGAPEGLVAAVIDEVGSEYPVAIAEECVRAVIFVDTKVGVEPIGDGVPRHRPTHPRL
jgi:hypothetical protein